MYKITRAITERMDISLMLLRGCAGASRVHQASPSGYEKVVVPGEYLVRDLIQTRKWANEKMSKMRQIH